MAEPDAPSYGISAAQGYVPLMKLISLLYCQPYNDNPEVIEKFNANIFSLAHQIFYSSSDTYRSVICGAAKESTL